MGYPGDKQTLVRTQYTPQSADPPNPVVGQVFNSDGTSRAEGLWRYTSSNTWEQLGAGNSGSKNYVTNPNINGDTSGYTASSANVTISEDTSTPLEGTGSIQIDILNTATTADYTEVSLDTFDRIDTEALNVIEISYDASSMESLNDVEIVAYDVTGTAELDTQAFSSFIDGKGKFIAQFTSTTSTEYTLRLKVAQVPTATSTLIIDEVKVGPYDKTYGVPTSDFTAYTPEWTDTSGTPDIGNGELDGFWRRVGDSIEVKVALQIGSTSNLGTGTEWRFSLPTGLQFDTSKLPTSGTLGMAGHAYMLPGAAANREPGNVEINDSTSVKVFGFQSSTIDRNEPFTWGTGDFLVFTYVAPIIGWSSEVNIVNGRKPNPTFSVLLSANQATVSGSQEVLFDDVTNDNYSAFNSGTSRYIIPVAGRYQVDYRLGFTANAGLANVSIERYDSGGTLQESFIGDYHNGGVLGMNATAEIECAAGDQIGFSVFDDTGSNNVRASSAGAQWTYASISKVPDQVEAIVGIEDRLWAEKFFNGTQTSDGTISDLTFNNLAVGKSYRVNMQFKVNINNGGTDSTIIVDTYNGSDRLTRLAYIDSDTNLNEIRLTNSVIFTATDTTVTFQAVSASANSFITGAGTTEGTFCQLEELQGISKTTKFD